MQFGEKIRLLRKRAGISQKDFAEQLGITRRALVYYENGERFPREAELIDKIADFFNVSSDFLTDDSESITMTKEEIFLEKAKAEDKLRGKAKQKNSLKLQNVYLPAENYQMKIKMRFLRY
ncbi:helix-turn-helix domain-containing protein [Petroclostridium xylanilyticum]|uniref:helix-turn-helix domain-containing protein n=1 Tax=Petroclostridium xylanilyticum TaxID=1792311 RepID=UPI0018E36DA5|nr:helix-turn-helix transcriptional regulator [Petroclostridium xylanilyticum]